jgi:hypothetical protein
LAFGSKDATIPRDTGVISVPMHLCLGQHIVGISLCPALDYTNAFYLAVCDRAVLAFHGIQIPDIFGKLVEGSVESLCQNQSSQSSNSLPRGSQPTYLSKLVQWLIQDLIMHKLL